MRQHGAADGLAETKANFTNTDSQGFTKILSENYASGRFLCVNGEFSDRF